MASILVTTMMLVVVSLTSVVAQSYSSTMKEMFQHSGACSTQHGKEDNDPDYYTTNSNLKHLPSASGFMGTHGTYRHFTVHEQTAMMIGEGKHGMWRIQGAGFVRVYRTQGEEGIKEEDRNSALDGKDMKLNSILVNHYTHQDGSENRDHKHSFGEEISEDGILNWLDLTIYHPKFEGKYNDHPVMDLPWYYCGLSGADYPHMGNVWKYVKAQKNANKVGPLGKRAGMDVNENFNAILRMELFGGAGVYTNVGQGNSEADLMQKTLEELKSRAQTAHYKRVDDSKVDMEFYIIERGYHNYPGSYLLIGMVMDSKVDPTDYAYVRPSGRYYDEILSRDMEILNFKPNFAPPTYVKDGEVAEKAKIYGMAIFGHNHPERQKHGLTGGVCPTKGGDCSTYPWGNSGAGWATDYEEITPICDGLVVDIKLWADLDKSWESETIGLGNAGYGTQEVKYSAHANRYGEFQDPWLVDQGMKNPQEVDFTEDGNTVKEAPNNIDDVPVVAVTIDFGQIGDQWEFEPVSLDPLPKGCAAEDKEKGCEEVRDELEEVKDEIKQLKQGTNGEHGDYQNYSHAAAMQVSFIVFLFGVAMNI